MTDAVRRPPRAAAPRADWMVLALAGSVALHAAALAALVFWHRAEIAEPGEGGGVALIFADTADLAAGATEAAPVAEAPPPTAPPPALPPPDAAAPPPLPDVARPSPPAPPAQADMAMPSPPPPPPPEPPTTPMREDPRPVQTASRSAPPPASRAAPGPVRLEAGTGALPDPSLGARAVGAVVPPGADAGHRNAPPAYPPESRRRGEEGVVRLALRVGPDGQVEDAEVSESSGHPALDRAALDAARRWRFRPATQGGLPVAATLRTAVHFRLTER